MAPSSDDLPHAHDALDLLTADHASVKGMFDNFSEMSETGAASGAKQELVGEIVAKLEAHEKVENEVFFPAVREVLKKDDVLGVAAEEQIDAGEVIGELGELDPADRQYDAKVLALGEQIREHAEEEEAAVFPQVKESNVDTEALGEAMLASQQSKR